jgi:hypothetical protein
MNRTKRTAKLRNIRLALTQQLARQGHDPAKIPGVVAATLLRAVQMPNIQLRRFAALVGA